MTFVLTDGQVEWIDALKGNAYEQVEGALQKDDGYCCLGVLCDLVDPDGWNEDENDTDWNWWWKGEAETPPENVTWDVALRSRTGDFMVNVFYYDGHWHLVGDADSMVMTLAEMEDVGTWSSLVSVNDSGNFTFEQIAQLVGTERSCR